MRWECPFRTFKILFWLQVGLGSISDTECVQSLRQRGEVGKQGGSSLLPSDLSVRALTKHPVFCVLVMTHDHGPVISIETTGFYTCDADMFYLSHIVCNGVG